MSKAIKAVNDFIAANQRAYDAASKVFTQIEAQSDKWADALASAGIMGADIRPFAVAYVADVADVAPTIGQRGLCFKKDSTEDNRVKYLVAVATGKAAAKAAKRKGSNATDLVAALLKKYAELTPAQKRSFKAKL